MIRKSGYLAIWLSLWASLAFGQAGPSTGTAYPYNAIPVTAVFAAADTVTASASIPAFPGRVSYICGFTVNGLGLTTGATVNVTVGPLIGTFLQGQLPPNPSQQPNSFSYQYTFPTGAAALTTPIGANYWPCIPASLPNTALAVTVPGGAGNTSTNINVQGYQLPAN
jgi:hypothetical protein